MNVCSLFVLFKFFCYLRKVTDGSQIFVFDVFSADIACHILGLLVAGVIKPIIIGTYKGLLRFCFKRDNFLLRNLGYCISICGQSTKKKPVYKYA